MKLKVKDIYIEDTTILITRFGQDLGIPGHEIEFHCEDETIFRGSLILVRTPHKHSMPKHTE